MLQESKTRRKYGVAFTMAQARKALHPYPVYESHFPDGTVVRMSFWTKAGKPFDFAAGRRACEAHRGMSAIMGHVEHDDPKQPWIRIADPHFTGDAVPAVTKPRINGAKLKKAAFAVVEQSANGGITPRAVRDLREALNIAA